jgi:threonine dehydratase
MTTIPKITFDDIKKASNLLEGIIQKTPTIYSPSLSEMLNVPLYLKLENLQLTGSFKERGAYIKIKSLDDETLKRGIITASAGNHAQAVALFGQKLNIPATIVMPLNTPFVKIERTKARGATVILKGKIIDDSRIEAQHIADKDNLSFIPAFDDPYVIQGQGTIALEMLEAYPNLDQIFVSIGGGGMISGIAIAAKHINPHIKIIGVESEAYPSMYSALHDNQPFTPKDTIADGIAVKKPGKITKHYIEKYVDDIVVVNEKYIEKAICLLAENQRVIAEGAGAVPLAALLEYPHLAKGQTGLVISGGNIDTRLLSSALMRGLVNSGRIHRLCVAGNDNPGMLVAVSQILASHSANVIEIKHERLFDDLPLKKADLEITLEIENQNKINDIKDALIHMGLMII